MVLALLIFWTGIYLAASEVRHFNKTGEQGIISSPGYPGYYFSKKNYYWRITVPEGKRIQVKFLDFGFPYSLTCPGDFLKVYNGGSSDDAVSVKYYAYGRRLPAAFNSSGRYLYLNFRSDEFTTGIGFKLEWKAFNQSATAGNQTRKTKARHFVVTGGQGYISSPGYPGYYYSDRDYYWRITVPEGKRVQVKFFDFGFPYSITCPGDFLKVYDGKSIDDAASEKYYNGNVRPASFNSTGRYLYLNFRSDTFTIGIGFNLEWKSV